MSGDDSYTHSEESIAQENKGFAKRPMKKNMPFKSAGFCNPN
jgi:hypothetical protein